MLTKFEPKIKSKSPVAFEQIKKTTRQWSIKGAVSDVRLQS